jgi:hypothetical protein
MDRNLGAFKCVASDSSLPQGNCCPRGNKPTVHVFFVALCAPPFFPCQNRIADMFTRFLASRRSRFAVTLPLCPVILLTSPVHSAPRRKNGARIRHGRRTSGQQPQAPLHFSLLIRDFQKNTCVLAIFQDGMNWWRTPVV